MRLDQLRLDQLRFQSIAITINCDLELALDLGLGLDLMLKSNRPNMAADPSLNHYGISWHDSAWIPILTPENVLEYFSQRTNPFYDRTCNNEMIKMQRLDMSQLT